MQLYGLAQPALAGLLLCLAVLRQNDEVGRLIDLCSLERAGIYLHRQPAVFSRGEGVAGPRPAFCDVEGQARAVITDGDALFRQLVDAGQAQGIATLDKHFHTRSSIF